MKYLDGVVGVGAWGHSPQGECGLKFIGINDEPFDMSHSPQGECGLKCMGFHDRLGLAESLPARGVWIEMLVLQRLVLVDSCVTPRKGSVD